LGCGAEVPQCGTLPLPLGTIVNTTILLKLILKIMVFQNLTPYSLVEMLIILTAFHQVPEDSKLHICNDGNHKSINVNYDHATTEASLLLPYEQEQKVMERQAY
jgi:hypothetical protein